VSNTDSFIEDLHNALVWTTYYDAVAGAVYALMIYKQFNSHLRRLVEIYEKYF
jgi:hypothetical protein